MQIFPHSNGCPISGLQCIRNATCLTKPAMAKLEFETMNSSKSPLSLILPSWASMDIIKTEFIRRLCFTVSSTSQGGPRVQRLGGIPGPRVTFSLSWGTIQLNLTRLVNRLFFRTPSRCSTKTLFKILLKIMLTFN